MKGLPLIVTSSMRNVSLAALPFKLKRTLVTVPLTPMGPYVLRSVVPSVSVPLEVSVHTVCQIPLNISTEATSLPPMRSRSKPKDKDASYKGTTSVRVMSAEGPRSSATEPGTGVVDALSTAVPVLVQAPLQPMPPAQLAVLKSSTVENAAATLKVAVTLESLDGKRNGRLLFPVKAPLHVVNSHPGSGVTVNANSWLSAKSSPTTGE